MMRDLRRDVKIDMCMVMCIDMRRVQRRVHRHVYMQKHMFTHTHVYAHVYGTAGNVMSDVIMPSSMNMLTPVSTLLLRVPPLNTDWLRLARLRSRADISCAAMASASALPIVRVDPAGMLCSKLTSDAPIELGRVRMHRVACEHATCGDRARRHSAVSM